MRFFLLGLSRSIPHPSVILRLLPWSLKTCVKASFFKYCDTISGSWYKHKEYQYWCCLLSLSFYTIIVTAVFILDIGICTLQKYNLLHQRYIIDEFEEVISRKNTRNELKRKRSLWKALSNRRTVRIFFALRTAVEKPGASFLLIWLTI